MKGLLIGNGWTDPLVQYPSYASYAYERELIKRDTDAGKQVDLALGQCLKKIEEDGVHITINECENILDTILRVTNDQYHSSHTLSLHRNVHEGCINMYDVRLRDSYPSCGMAWPPDLVDVTPYLRVLSPHHLTTNCSATT